MKTPDLKPCQAAARGTIRWGDDWQENYFICQADCTKYEHHAAERISKENLDGLVAMMVERNVMHELCKGCKEVDKNDDEK